MCHMYLEMVISILAVEIFKSLVHDYTRCTTQERILLSHERFKSVWYCIVLRF